MKSYFSLVGDKLRQMTKKFFIDESPKEIVIEVEEEKPLNIDIPGSTGASGPAGPTGAIGSIESFEGIERLLTISQAAKLNKVTRQAVYFAIKMKRLEAKKEGDTWLISSKDLKSYMKNKYSRAKSRKEGELIFDKQKGFYSISEVAKILRKDINQMYYIVRMGRIKTFRQGGNIVIKDEDLKDFIDTQSKKSSRKVAI